MRILFLDIASHNGLLACSTEDEVLVSKRVDHRVRDQELIPVVEAMLKQAKWEYGDLTHISCVIGPGGFTSLRVAVSFTNVLSWALRIPVAGVHLSDVCSARIQNSDLARAHGRVAKLNIKNYVWMHSTKKHEVFVRGFGVYAKKWPEPTHVSIEEFLRQVPEDVSYTGELLPEHVRKEWKSMSLRAIQEVLPAFLSKQLYAKNMLYPWYGRDG